MMDRIKTAVIGCGKFGHFHARAYRALPQCELAAACNHNLPRAREFAAEYGVPAYDSIGKMIDAQGIRAVSICTPHPAHAACAIEAMEHGAHVLIEKPMAASLQDCDAIMAAAAKAGVLVGITSQRRYYRPCMRIREAIDCGKIGKPILGEALLFGWRDSAYYRSDPWRGTWDKEGGGVLVNQAPHQLDLLLWYMGEVDEVYGRWDTLNHPGLEVEDTAVAVIRFKNGGLGSIILSNSQNPALYGKVHIHGSNGASVGVQTDGGAMFIAGVTSIAEPPVNDLWTVNGEIDKLNAWQKEDRDFFNSVDPMHYFLERQIEDFTDAALKGREPLVGAVDGRRTVELFTAVYRSQRDNRPVRFPLKPEYGGDFDGRIPGGKAGA
jgi:UDP-N-acetyl-2-amino-2-deoxyglucuronate dehydrogenase